jgi:hypothetical protein
MDREAAGRCRNQLLPDVKRPTIPDTQLPEAKPDDVLFLEWTTYRPEVGRWLAEGHEGERVLINGDRVLGLSDTRRAARAEGFKQYLMESFLVHQIQREEPVCRLRGYS